MRSPTLLQTSLTFLGLAFSLEPPPFSGCSPSSCKESSFSFPFYIPLLVLSSNLPSRLLLSTQGHVLFNFSQEVTRPLIQKVYKLPGYSGSDLNREPSAMLLLGDRGALDRANYYGTVNTALNLAAVHMQSAKYEAVFSGLGSTRCILPTCYCLPKGWSLPVADLLQVLSILFLPPGRYVSCKM
jgi:hypothetical protein